MYMRTCTFLLLPFRNTDMLRYLKNRCYQVTKNSALLVLLAFVISFIVLMKLLPRGFHDPSKQDKENKVVPLKVISDQEREIRQLIRLSEKKTFDDKHEYSISRFSQFQSERQSNNRDFIRDGHYIYFMPIFRPMKLLSPSWFFAGERFCNGCFVSYGKRVARLKDVLIDPSYAKNTRGGERLKAVLNQSEELEYLHLDKGYFYLMTVNQFPHYNDKFVLNDFKLFLDALTVENMQLVSDRVQHKTTIVIVRHEYANFYHTMMDWYGVFLLMILFHVDNRHLQILWLDAHPKSNLDVTWKTLFGDTQQARSIKEPTLYKDMIWDAVGATNPFNQHKADILPFSREFRYFFMSQHGIKDSHSKKCDKLNIRLILRHKYVAHPRNPDGYMTRKIKNEKEIIEALKNSFKEDKIERVVLESMIMKNQIELISQTDILIGMHGAGLTHIVFLPNTSGVIELIPRYFSPTNKHFHALAKWRQLDYMMWRNEDNKLEKNNHFTVVPEDLLVEMVREMRRLMCGKLHHAAHQTERPDADDKGMFSYDVD